MSKEINKSQFTKGDPNCPKKLGLEDYVINFSSSPNLKNIKKFSKVKIDGIEDKTPPVLKSDPSPPLDKGKIEKKTEVQPPLPLDPPPTDPPITSIQVNQGNDIVYNIKPEEDTKLFLQTEDMIKDLSPKQNTKKKVDPCRDFIRGTCTRVGCIYEHRYDISEGELQKLYTFCRNYQSRVCIRAQCKYVHATVFEEQHFYRTGELPPHVFAHHKKSVLPPPPPPPPPEEPVNDFSNPPPQIEKQAPAMVSCVPDPALVTRALPPVEILNPVTQKVPLPLKRDWSTIDTPFDNPSCEDELANKILGKKCKTCETTEFRAEYKKMKLDKAKMSYDEIVKKRKQVEKTIGILDLVLAKFKPGLSDLFKKSAFGDNK